MKPINALRMIFTRQKSVPRTDLEYLYTDEQGLASAQALANKHNGEEKVFYNMALVFMAYSGSGTKSLMEMLTTSHKKLKMDPNIGFSCSFDLIFAEVLAFNFHAAMENFWKDQDDREKYDKGDDVYYHDDEGEKEDFEYFESIKHARAFADALIKALSRVPLPDDFLALRMRSYFNVALRKKSLDESFVNNLLNRIFPNNQDDLLCLDRTLMAPFCMSFIVSGNFEDFIKACKQTYLECSSELAGNPISLV